MRKQLLKYQLINLQNFIKAFFILLVVSLVLVKPYQEFLTSFLDIDMEFSMLDMNEESEEENFEDEIEEDEVEEYLYASYFQIKDNTFHSNLLFWNDDFHVDFIKGIIIPPPRTV